MTPSLVAGVIANEKQRKTLHYLLASSLTSMEIVLGKLMARMLHVAVFLAIGLPVISLLSLFGGVDPLLILLAVAGTFTSAFFLAAMSVYCSTISKRVREAIIIAYTIEGAWFALPPIIRSVMPGYSPRLYSWIRPVNDWLLASTPWGPFYQVPAMFRIGVSGLVEATAWMMALQVGLGIGFLGLSVVRLRPIFKAQEGSPTRRFLGVIPVGKTRAIRLFSRKPVGDDAMLWKELHTTKTSGIAQVAVILLSLTIAGVILYWSAVYALEAFVELQNNSYDSWGTSRGSFNAYLRFITTTIGTLTILSASVAGANTITSEREDDTWLSLITTPMSGQEIMLAKMVGILWNMRWAGLLLCILWIMGLVTGSVHLLGVLGQGIEILIFVSFAITLGTWVSMRSQSSCKSQAMTTAILVTLMGGYLTCLCPFMVRGRPSYLVFSGVTPFIQAVTLFSPSEYRDYLSGSKLIGQSRDEAIEFVIACVGGTLGYGAGALYFLVSTVWGFDVAADRPRR